MKKFVLLASAVLFALTLGLGSAVAKDMPKDPIMVDSGAGEKPGVKFDHKVHKEKKALCHPGIFAIVGKSVSTIYKILTE